MNQSTNQSGIAARKTKLGRAVCETLEARRMLTGGAGGAGGLPADNVQDLTAITSVGNVVTIDAGLQGPYQFPFTNGQVKEEVVQPDGKRLVAGYAGGNWVVARYNTDGSLDSTFGGGDGKSVNDLGTASDRALNISLRPDGKIILLGVISGSGDNWQFAAIRLNSDGSLDTTFADNGKLLSGLGRAPTYGGLATVLKDGRIHMTGWDGITSRGMEFDSDGKNGFDRLANLGGQLQAQSISDSSHPVWSGPGPLARLAVSGFVGPNPIATQPLHPASLPTAQEGSDYSLDLLGGDGWNIDWGDNSSEYVPGHAPAANHTFADGPAPALITATSDSIYLRSGETLIPDTAEQLTLTAGTLSIESGGTLDLKDNDLVVENGNFSTLQQLVFEGYSATTEEVKTGLISSVGQTQAGLAIHALFDNAQAGFTDWPQGSGIAVSANAIVGKYTYLGDSNMDGMVTPQDLTAFDANLGTTGIDLGIAWFYGDTNFDGSVTAQDMTGFDSAMGLGVGNPLQSNGNFGPVVQVMQSVDVQNVAPTVTIEGAASEGQEGTPIEMSAFATDPGWVDNVNLSWTVTKNGTAFESGSDEAISFTPDDEGTYIVSVSASDSTASSQASTTIQVADIAPKMTISGAAQVAVNQVFSASVTSSDPGVLDTLSDWTIDWGDGSSSPLASNVSTSTHQYLTTGTYTVKASATDAAGTHESNHFDVAVRHPGDVNMAFGVAGESSVSRLAGLTPPGEQTRIASGNRILSAGVVQNTSTGQQSIMVAARDQSGLLDTTFGTGGWTILPFSGGAAGTQLALQADGKILVLSLNGVVSAGRYLWKLSRLTENGQLDQDFGVGGVIDLLATLGRTGNDKLVVAPDGKIVVIGWDADHQYRGPQQLQLRRFTSAGQPDLTFGDGGALVLPIPRSDGFGLVEAVLQSDGTIVIVGFNWEDFVSRIGSAAILKVSIDGELIAGFADGGMLSVPLTFGAAPAFALDADNRMLIGAVDTAGHNQILRYTSDGVLDGNFGVSGKVETQYFPKALALQPDGRIVMVSQLFGYGRLSRLLPDGTFDTSFGTGGEINLPHGSTSVALMGDGEIICSEGFLLNAFFGSSFLDLVSHRTGMKFGESISQTDEESGNPSNYLILTNNDSEEQLQSGVKDYDNSTAQIPTGNAPNDDDLARFTLKRLPTVPSTGTISIELSDPTSVRLFKSDGTMLYGPGGNINNLTLHLDNRSGYLSTITSGDLDIWLEGLHKDADFKFSIVMKDWAGRVVARDDVHMTIAEWKFIGSDGNETDGVANIAKSDLVGSANGDPDAAPVRDSEKFKIQIDGATAAMLGTVRVTSEENPNDFYDDTLMSNGSALQSQNFAALYYSRGSGDVLTPVERSATLAALGLNAVHNPRGVATTQGKNAQTRPVPVNAQQALIARLQDEEDRHKEAAYYNATGLSTLFPQLSTIAAANVTAQFKTAAQLGTATARYTSNSPYAGGVMDIQKSVDSITVTHEMIHAFNRQNGNYQGSDNGTIQKDEALAWGLQRLLESAKFLRQIEVLTPADGAATAKTMWKQAWGGFGFMGIYTEDVPPVSILRKQTAADLWDVNSKLHVRFSAGMLRPIYENLLANHGITEPDGSRVVLPALTTIPAGDSLE